MALTCRCVALGCRGTQAAGPIAARTSCGCARLEAGPVPLLLSTAVTTVAMISLTHGCPAPPKPAMPLVAYPDSASDDEGRGDNASPAKPVVAKRKLSHGAHDAAQALPPLPAAFHDLYATNARVSTSDNPDLHGGRRRAVPHVEGNWPSHVYLECKAIYPRGTDRLHAKQQTNASEGYQPRPSRVLCTA